MNNRAPVVVCSTLQTFRCVFPAGLPHLPPHGLVLVVPLGNVSTLSGPTEFQVGSHVSVPGDDQFWERQQGAVASFLRLFAGFAPPPILMSHTTLLLMGVCDRVCSFMP